MRHYLALQLATLSMLFATNVLSEWHKSEHAVMGTVTYVDIWHENASVAENCSKQVFDEMERVNQLMSPWIENSELYRINQNAANQEMKISNETYNLIDKSIAISKASEGAFDITFASVGYMYDYRNKIRPEDNEINRNLDAIDYRHIQLNPGNSSIKLKHKNVKLDFGGIAKGHAVDNSITLLKKCGIKNGMVSAGGDSRIIGDRNGKPWVMGVRHPRQENKIVVRLPVSDAAVSTSGDYERFYIEDGERHHHIINPETGKSVKNTWSATVIGNDATTTDALSTTLFVLGNKKAMKLIEEFEGIDAIIIDSNGKMHYSSGLMSPEPSTTPH